MPLHWIAYLWHRSFEVAFKGRGRWQRVRDPIAAAAVQACDIGWSNAGPAKLRIACGSIIDLRKVGPRSVAILADRAIGDHLLGQAADRHAHLRDLGPGSTPWIGPLKSLVVGRSRHADPLERTMVTSAAAGCLWTPSRIFDAGLSNTDLCPNGCGKRCTLFHVCWGVCTEQREVVRRKVKGYAELVDYARGDAENPFWVTGVMSAPGHLVPSVPDMIFRWVVVPSVGEDGSSRALLDEASRRGACAAVQMGKVVRLATTLCHDGMGVISSTPDAEGVEGPYDVVAAAVMSLPGPLQDTPLAEVLACWIFLRHAVDSMQTKAFHTDCKWVLDTFKRGRSFATGAGPGVFGGVGLDHRRG